MNRSNDRRYNDYNARLETFSNWADLELCQSAESMAKAGFFRCNETTDLVECFKCHVKLHAWHPTDEALSEHEKWSPFCPFVQLQKFELLAILLYILPLITVTETQSMLRRDPNVCTVCVIDMVSVELWPCHHRLTCFVCSIGIIRCPRCNILVTQKNRINDE